MFVTLELFREIEFFESHFCIVILSFKVLARDEIL